jgi:glutathione S-transferase
MSLPNPVKLIGGVGSPYTRKMLSYLRYKRIPHTMIWGDPGAYLEKIGLEKPKPGLLPTFILPDESGDLKAVTDSSPIIKRLDDEVNDRSTIPSDPALAFLNYLLEDFADEWGTKFMFHYRWHDTKDAENAGTILPLQMMGTMSDEILNNFKTMISKRQIDRLWVVGSNNDTAPIIDASLRRLLKILESHFTSYPYLIGKRPSSSDFALFGQFSQLVNFDPTPREIMHEVSMRTVAWVGVVEDLSGIEVSDEDWLQFENLPQTIIELLIEIGKGYVPALLANAKAIGNGEKEWETEIDGCIWRQKSFPYQAKCLKWINEEYNLLADSNKSKVNNLLKDTGCEELLIN